MPINYEKLKKERERKIFNSFIKVRDIKINFESIESKNPPEPDILCEINGKYIAYELTEIVIEEIPKNLGGKQILYSEINNYYENLGSYKDNFDEKYNGHFISFHFNSDYSIQEIKQSLTKIFKVLINLPKNYLGDFGLPRDIQKMGLMNINISKIQCRGVLFNIVGPFWADPNEKETDFLKKKFNKTYKTNHNIHLIGYFENNPCVINNIWMPNIKKYIRDNINTSLFEKVWIFDVVNKKILFSYERYYKNN